MSTNLAIDPPFIELMQTPTEVTMDALNSDNPFSVYSEYIKGLAKEAKPSYQIDEEEFNKLPEGEKIVVSNFLALPNGFSLVKPLFPGVLKETNVYLDHLKEVEDILNEHPDTKWVMI